MLKLLIVDDERPFRQGIRYAIDWASHGIEIIGEAANGQDAVEMVKDYSPDIIITDIVMPVIDGVELSMIARSMVPDVYIIVLSAYSDSEWMQRTIAVGINDYLLKSADADAVLKAAIKGKSHIEHKRSRISGKELKRSVWNDFLPAIRDDFFSRIVDSVQMDNQQIDAAEALDIQITGPQYIVALCRTDAKRALSLAAKLEMQLARYKPLIAIPEDGLVAIVANVGEQSDALREELSSLEKAYEFILFLSPLLDDFHEIGQAYRCLLRLSLGAFWLKEGCPPLDSIEEIPGSTQELQVLEERLVQSIFNRLNEASWVILRELKDAAQAILMPVDLFRQMLGRVISVAASIEQKEGLLHEKLESLNRAQTPDEMLAVLSDMLGQEETGQRNQLVENAIRYIDAHYAEPLTLHSVAENTFVSPNYLSHIFRNKMGVGLREYIVRKRISEAKKFLAGSSHKVNEIAALVGYNSYKQFAEHFLNYTGMSAKQYRKEIVCEMNREMETP